MALCFYQREREREICILFFSFDYFIRTSVRFARNINFFFILKKKTKRQKNNNKRRKRTDYKHSISCFILCFDQHFCLVCRIILHLFLFSFSHFQFLLLTIQSAQERKKERVDCIKKECKLHFKSNFVTETALLYGFQLFIFALRQNLFFFAVSFFLRAQLSQRKKEKKYFLADIDNEQPS